MSSPRPVFRPKIFPQRLEDWVLFTFALVLIPVVYTYEMIVVLPLVTDENRYFRNIVLFGGGFVFINIVANFVGLVVTDTSVPKKVISVEKIMPNWEYCSDCISYVPPRAWHCKHCQVCILKRDHHCAFSAVCVGHFNHRYFLMFLIFMNIGTLYCVISNSIYLLQKIDFSFPTILLKIGLPFVAVYMDYETVGNELCIFLYVIVLSTFILTGALLAFHIKGILNGQVTHEVQMKRKLFDYGKLQNIKEVLGERWFFAWIFPFIRSDLPHDGINWETSEIRQMRLHQNSVKDK